MIERRTLASCLAAVAMTLTGCPGPSDSVPIDHLSSRLAAVQCAFATRCGLSLDGLESAVREQITDCPAQLTVFVDATQTGGDGTKTRPFTTIGEAIDARPIGNPMIAIAAGTYREVITTNTCNIILIDTSSRRTPDDYTVRKSIVGRFSLVESDTVFESKIRFDLIFLNGSDLCRINNNLRKVC